MVFAKQCDMTATNISQPSRERRDRAHGDAATGQAAHAIAIDAAQSRRPLWRQPSQRCPSRGAQAARARMACGGEYRGNEDDGDSCGARPHDLRRAMRRGADPGQSGRCQRGASGPQVQAGMATCRQPPVAGHHQGQSALAADARHPQSQFAAIRRAIMAEHHSGQATRQRGHHGAQVGLPALIGEQPQWRWPPRRTRLDLARP